MQKICKKVSMARSKIQFSYASCNNKERERERERERQTERERDTRSQREREREREREKKKKRPRALAASSKTGALIEATFVARNPCAWKQRCLGMTWKHVRWGGSFRTSLGPLTRCHRGVQTKYLWHQRQERRSVYESSREEATTCTGDATACSGDVVYVFIAFCLGSAGAEGARFRCISCLAGDARLFSPSLRQQVDPGKAIYFGLRTQERMEVAQGRCSDTHGESFDQGENTVHDDGANLTPEHTQKELRQNVGVRAPCRTLDNNTTEALHVIAAKPGPPLLTRHDRGGDNFTFARLCLPGVALHVTPSTVAGEDGKVGHDLGELRLEAGARPRQAASRGTGGQD